MFPGASNKKSSVVAADVSPKLGDAHLSFEAFSKKHGKAYSFEEEPMRRRLFEETKRSVVAQNEL